MEHIRYEVDGPIGVISLDRTEKANAVDQQALDELNMAFEAAATDREIRVIVLRAEGKHFCAGHDITASNTAVGREAGEATPQTAVDWDVRGLQAIYEWETIHYLGYSRRWRDIPKPTIAAVQGQCIAGGLMLCWPCDLIVAADNARFSDPVVRMGIGGVEYHAHTWEVGARKAKEMLFTAQPITAQQALESGMVNRVVPLDDLLSETMDLAGQIAEMHPFALAQAKRAVNQTLDVQGFYSALQSVFDIHQTGHGNAMTVGDYPILVNLDQMKDTNRD
ncbi:MAG: enoyl-CoA hydratase [Actinomycetota bacterium]|mgnify:FL=1|nr:enoyl-CoA hydratase [Acidimicrobiales bacterium]MEC8947721.1 enoyl-CoA hydratase [Actinomycetota bacterium]MEC9426640.1 enoyl-CoA hydratase [Actinomycetota bacterium]MED5393854.1 enoyl-CoA hydratase [Actinomycetota bacterium]MED6329500.1 enoyl-CoA hydratase [Actinomycetota bacterium]